MTTPAQPQEAALIERARKTRRPPLSIRQAAPLAGISEGRWRQIEAGYQTVSAGVRTPVVAVADTLARMAEAVGLSPDDLRAVGREDAADKLETLLSASVPANPLEEFSEAELLAELGRRVASLLAENRRLTEVVDSLTGTVRFTEADAADPGRWESKVRQLKELAGDDVELVDTGGGDPADVMRARARRQLAEDEEVVQARRRAVEEGFGGRRAALRRDPAAPLPPDPGDTA